MGHTKIYIFWTLIFLLTGIIKDSTYSLHLIQFTDKVNYIYILHIKRVSGWSRISRRRSWYFVLPVGDVHAPLPSRNFSFPLQSLEGHRRRIDRCLRRRRQVRNHAEGGQPVRRRCRSGGGRWKIRQIFQVHLASQQLVLFQVCLLRNGQHRHALLQLLGHRQIFERTIQVLKIVFIFLKPLLTTVRQRL